MKSGVSVSYRLLSLQKISLPGLQNKTFWGLSALCKDSCCRARWGAWKSHSLGRISTIVIILLVWGSPILGVWGSWLYCVFIPASISLWFLRHIFSYRWFSLLDLVFVINSFSVYSCNFDVPVGTSKLRVFLLCPFGHSPISPLYRSNEKILEINFKNYIDSWTIKRGSYNTKCELT